MIRDEMRIRHAGYSGFPLLFGKLTVKTQGDMAFPQVRKLEVLVLVSIPFLTLYPVWYDVFVGDIPVVAVWSVFDKKPSHAVTAITVSIVILLLIDQHIPQSSYSGTVIRQIVILVCLIAPTGINKSLSLFPAGRF